MNFFFSVLEQSPWIATVFSFWLPFRAARVYAKHDPFHYTTLCLFGMVWAFLFPFWFDKQNYIFGVYGGFLLTLVGNLLTKAAGTPAVPLPWTLRLAAIVFALGVYGSLRGYDIPHAPMTSAMKIEPQQAGLVSAIALDVFGFVAIWRALDEGGHWLHRLLTITTAIYVIVEVWFLLAVFDVCSSPGHTGTIFPVIFAALKASYTAIVVSLVIMRCWTPADAALPRRECLLKLIH